MAEGKRPLLTDEGIQVSATCPVIISASRATDLPAYYADWFIHRLRRGYVRWVNSFNPHLPYYVSFEDTRAIVFWSRNPLPLFPHLDELDHRGFIYYFQVTLTDYGPEGLEPGVPPLDERISTFIRLSEQIGRDRVIWRFDPVLLTSSLDMDTLLSRIAYIGNRIAPFTNKFVFSFVDTSYSKVKKQAGIWHFRSPDPADKEKFIEGIIRMNRTWGITLASCADEAWYGPEIEQNRLLMMSCSERLVSMIPPFFDILIPVRARIPASGLHAGVSKARISGSMIPVFMGVCIVTQPTIQRHRGIIRSICQIRRLIR
jgi:hypothetical protein